MSHEAPRASIEATRPWGSRFIRWYSEVGLEDIALVGGKNAGLGELMRGVSSAGARVPDGFIVTTAAFQAMIEENGLLAPLHQALDVLDPRDIPALTKAGAACRSVILAASLPPAVARAIRLGYRAFSERHGSNIAMAVRSSATAEDLPAASFAGLHDSFLNIQGEEGLLNACMSCFASLFTDRAISYRIERGFDHFSVRLAVGVQEMVHSESASSGVMFTLDTESGFRDVVLIDSAYGLGEGIVKGVVTPDEFCVFKPTLNAGYIPIVRRSVAHKELKLVYSPDVPGAVCSVNVSDEIQDLPSLEDTEILSLARWACAIEEHFQHHLGVETPMDIEWAKDGNTKQIFIVQARPETVHAGRKPLELRQYILKLPPQEPLLVGISVGNSVASGKVRLVHTPAELHLVQDGEILVAPRTEPDWEPAMKKTAGIITDLGGRTCHAAIVSREMGIPAIVGCGAATRTLHPGQQVTVSCAQGSTGVVYEGWVPHEVRVVKIEELPRPKTKVLLTLADPAQAFHLAQLPADGVGLLRIEFIISAQIGIHPLALLELDKVSDRATRESILERTSGYLNPAQYFIDRLAEGIGTIAAAFYPREVIVRFSDFKTNEYAGLLGGLDFEPTEENPMLGFRGASRYYHPRYRKGFALECAAIQKARGQFGLSNIKVMIPFCRTIEEAQRVLSELSANGLFAEEPGFEIYVMCEVPSNVILAAEFAEIFAGFSIGSNDLTQLTLGVDRDSEIVAPLFDERNKAVVTLVRSVIREARRRRKKIGICGQAPSDYPEFIKLLVDEGIDSISLSPDAFLSGLKAIAEAERPAVME